MTQPILIVVNQSQFETLISVDISYVDSMCSHLKKRGIEYERSSVVSKETGCDKLGQWWEFIGVKIKIKDECPLLDILNNWLISN